jgi:hypothetical protein
MMLPLFHFSLGIFAFRELHKVLVWKPEGKRRWEVIGMDLYIFLLPKSRVLRASTRTVQVKYILYSKGL